MMTTAKHTDGPWRVSESGLTTNDGQIAVLAGDDRIALVDAPEAFDTPKKNRWRIESPTRKANADLIAAAPELLDALKAGESLISGDLVGAEWKRACADFLTKARAALSKATPAS